MKNLQSKMGSSNQSLPQRSPTTPITTQRTLQAQQIRSPSNISNTKNPQSSDSIPRHLPHHQTATTASISIDDYKVQFTISPKNHQLIIKCTSLTTKKKFTSSYRHQNLPKAIQVTYKSVQELFQEIKYIVDENVQNRLSIKDDGKVVFSLETKKKGKAEYLPEVFEMEEENEERVIHRLQEDVERLKEEDERKDVKIIELQLRLMVIQKLLRITPSSKDINNHNYSQNYNRLSSPLSTIEHLQHDLSPHSNSQSRLQQQQSIIKKFKRSKSNQNLQLKNIHNNQQSANNPLINNTLLKTAIKDYDCFVELQVDELKVQLLSRKQAKIYKCIITSQNIPKQVYSFVPTPKALYDQIAYIIRNKIKNRLDVVDNNFVYRASINTKNQEVLVDGLFETIVMQQDDLERIQDMVDIRTSALETTVKQLQLEVELLKVSLQSNDIILEKPQNFINSTILTSTPQFITLCRFFKSKIFKIDLLYRASENNFEIKKFHERCDNIPNTLTLVSTQFNKVIGGFTSQLWDKNGNGRSVSDYQAHSFIFSLTNRHKFTLQQHEHAIQVSAQDGPRFGNGADLVIKDKANENNNSYANICTSYSHPRYTYKNSESYKLFSGDDKNNRFAAKQWEVFEVFFEE